jgi:hypothetical protein
MRSLAAGCDLGCRDRHSRQHDKSGQFDPGAMMKPDWQ